MKIYVSTCLCGAFLVGAGSAANKSSGSSPNRPPLDDGAEVGSFLARPWPASGSGGTTLGGATEEDWVDALAED